VNFNNDAAYHIAPKPTADRPDRPSSLAELHRPGPKPPRGHSLGEIDYRDTPNAAPGGRPDRELIDSPRRQ
jgi:hypothetical protein